MTTRLPPAIADTAHLTEVLRRSGVLGQGRVAAIAVDGASPTILSHVFRLRPTYEGAAAGAPDTLVLKAGVADRPGGPRKGGRHEVAFYADVASATPAGLVPRCFEAHWNPNDGTWHLLLEDLAGSHRVATQWPLPPTLDRCEAIVRARARFQAAWWDDPRLGVAVGTWQDVDASDQSLRELVDQFARFAGDLGDRLSARRRDLYIGLFESAPRLMARYHARRHMTVVQGDSHVWNCFLPRDGGLDDARLFDWDAWRIDVGTDDLAYMMAVHWYPDSRSAFERRLLDRHHEELLRRSVRDYDRRALQDDYRLSVLWQIATPVWQQANGIPPVIWWNNLERIHLAVDDLDCRDLLAG